MGWTSDSTERLKNWSVNQNITGLNQGVFYEIKRDA